MFPHGRGRPHLGRSLRVRRTHCSAICSRRIPTVRTVGGQDGGEEEGPLDGVKVQVRYAQITRRIPPAAGAPGCTIALSTDSTAQTARSCVRLSDVGAMPSVMAQLCPASQPIETEAGL